MAFKPPDTFVEVVDGLETAYRSGNIERIMRIMSTIEAFRALSLWIVTPWTPAVLLLCCSAAFVPTIHWTVYGVSNHPVLLFQVISGILAVFLVIFMIFWVRARRQYYWLNDRVRDLEVRFGTPNIWRNREVQDIAARISSEERRT